MGLCTVWRPPQPPGCCLASYAYKAVVRLTKNLSLLISAMRVTEFTSLNFPVGGILRHQAPHSLSKDGASGQVASVGVPGGWQPAFTLSVLGGAGCRTLLGVN